MPVPEFKSLRERLMRTCSYCGKEHPNGVTECSIEGQVSGEKEPKPPLPSPPTATSVAGPFPLTERTLRFIELMLVCSIAVGGSVLISIFSLFARSSSENFGGVLQWSYGILDAGAALVLLWYVLLRRSRRLSDIGFSWKWTDIGWSFVLCVGGYIAYCLIYAILYYSGISQVDAHAASSAIGKYVFGNGVFVVTLIFTCINPFFEELIVRAYLMTEVRQLTNSAGKAIFWSTLLQTSYHLYQGIPLATSAGAMFLLWSVYYAKTGRVTPIILAHLYFDVGSALLYLARH